MRVLLLLVVLAAALTGSLAAQDAPVKYWVFFTDKPEAAKAVTVSEATLERRAVRASRPAGWYDRPVATSYLDALRAEGAEPLVASRWLNAASAVLDSRTRTAVEALPFVVAVRPVGQRVEPPVPSDTAPASKTEGTTQLDYGPSFTQLAVMNAVEPLENGINGAGILLGFLDTTFGDFQHPAFAHLREDNRLLGYQDFAQGPQSNTHGLNVASVAVGFDEGQLIGPAHGASVLAATTEFAPTETNQEEDNLVAGLEWMEAEGADVVNISLGYTEFDAGQQSYTPADLDGDTAVTTRAVDIAAGLGVVVVTSAGNSGGSTAWPFVGTPADADSVIAVGAIRADSVRAFFSSLGPTADGRIKPDVVAMGDDVVIAAGSSSYVIADGTSFSSPLVAAVVCQMLQVNPDLGPIDVRNILRWTASQVEAPDNQLGWGIVDAAAAVAAAGQTATSREPGSVTSDALTLAAPFPNPVVDRATFLLTAAQTSPNVRLSIYNVLGQRVAVPFDGAVRAGTQRIVVRTGGLPAGLYVYRLEGGPAPVAGTFVVAR